MKFNNKITILMAFILFSMNLPAISANSDSDFEIPVPKRTFEQNSEHIYKVLRVIDGDTLYLDFNRDGQIQPDERVRLNGIDAFEVKPTTNLEWQSNRFKLTQDEALGLGYLGKEFAKRELSGKYVKAEYTGETLRCLRGRHLMSIYYSRNANLLSDKIPTEKLKNFEAEILKAGLATVYKQSNLAAELKTYENFDLIRKNAKKTSKFNLVLLNKNNGKYHKPTCEYGQSAAHVELVNLSKICKHKPAGCCYPQAVSEEKVKEYKYSKKSGKPDVQEGNIQLYFLSPLKQKRPQNSCKTEACRTLLYEIDNAKESIDFAIYGIEGQDKIFNALINAKNRGVKIRWVTDKTETNKNIYFDTYKLMNKITTFNTDYDSFDSLNIPEYKYKLLYQGALMHNKFFIFDKSKVFTGSTNISSTCLTGYNSNVVVFINSSKIANIYEQEFLQMFNGKFHNEKKPNTCNENIKLNYANISVYFSPIDKTSSTKIIPFIQKSRNYIYVPAFYLTHQGITEALIDAKKRGVDVKIIVDKTSVEGKYVKLDLFKDNQIEAKVENWSGKMHMKSMIIDDNTLIIGSMNFTKQGEIMNDENCIIIQNVPKLTKNYKKHFMRLWDSIK